MRAVAADEGGGRARGALAVVGSARSSSATRATPLPRFLAIGAILALASFLRLQRLDLVEFRTDEAQALRLTEDIVRLGHLQLVGLTSSVNIHNPPEFLYFLTPIVAVSRDPRLATGAIGLANVGAVAGLMVFGWRAFSPLAGLVAGLAFAANPWAVLYARKIWAQDLLAPLAVLFFVALDRAVVRRNGWWSAATLPIFAIGVEMHFSFGLLFPLLLAPVGTLVASRQWRFLALGVALTLLTAAPYLVFNFQSDWSDLRAAEVALRLPAIVDGQGPALVAGLASSWDNWYVPENIHLDRLLPGRISAVAANIQTGLLLLGAGVTVVLTLQPCSAQRGRRMLLGGLLLGLVLPAVLTIRHNVPLYEHYYLFVLPVAGLVIGVGFDWLSHLPGAWGRVMLRLAVAALLVMAAIHTLIVVRLLDRVATVLEPSFGPTLVQSEALANDIASFGVATGSRHLVVEFSGADAEPLAYLARPSFPTVELAGVGLVGLGPGRAATPSPPSAPSLLGPAEAVDIRSLGGVQILYAASSRTVAPSERAGLAITWTTDGSARASESALAWEASLYDPRGALVTRGSGVRHVLTPDSPAERIVSWFALQTEQDAVPGHYELRLRAVDPDTGQPFAFLDAAGRSATAWTSRPVDVP